MKNTDEQNIGSHVEHILPKEIHPELTFDYDNLMFSCFATGGEIKADEKDHAPVSCGHAALKRTNNFDESLFIKPTDSDCERYFSFELDGEILPHPKLNDNESQRAQYTIGLLNLNCLRLKRLREDVIIEGYKIIDDLQDSVGALQHFLELETLEFNGKLRDFINLRKQHFN